MERSGAAWPRPWAGGPAVTGPPGLPCTRVRHQLLLGSTMGSAFPPARPPVQVRGHHPGWAHGSRKVNTQAGSDCHGHGASAQPESEGQECLSLKVRNASPGAPSSRGQSLRLQVLGEPRSPRTASCSETPTGHRTGEQEPSRDSNPQELLTGR